MLATAAALVVLAIGAAQGQAQGPCNITTQHLPDPPYDNYFYSDCNVDAQVVVTSPLPDSNLTIIGPRLIVAWPAGNSGICTFFQPSNGANGTLAIKVVNSTVGSPLALYKNTTSNSTYPFVGVQGVVSFNASATLTVPILGSIRTIRDFTEGPSILQPVIQNAINITQYNGTGASLSRMWLDNTTITTFTLVPLENNGTIQINSTNRTISLGAGLYHFTASFNYPQLTQLTAAEVLNGQSQYLITSQGAETTSLQFLSYTEKLLAGAWRFLTYFGRDSMIFSLLSEPILSTGNGSAMEAVIGAVLERINRTDGSVCHEETIGDYATFLNMQQGIYSTAAGFSYPMIDTDFYLPVLMAEYFTQFPSRVGPLFSTKAGSIDSANLNLTYGQLALQNAEKIMNVTAAFETNQTVQNLIHLKPDQPVGEWRDSNYGIANGRIPFDVNCALAPAALRGISILAAIPGVFPNATNSTNCTSMNYTAWETIAAKRSKVWTDRTLQFFQFNETIANASANLAKFTAESTFYNGPTHNDSLAVYCGPNGTVTTYALALNGTTNTTSIAAQKIPILHSDNGFRLFLVNDTRDSQLTPFLNATAQAILRPFPAGLTTPSGMVVANPALSGSDVLIANFTNAAYHGTVIWSWQLALMAKGFERQLARCNASSGNASTAGIPWWQASKAPRIPGFCNDTGVYNTARAAYNALWDTIEANAAQLDTEVWSWEYSAATDNFTTVPLGSLPPPPGAGGATESDIRQLWSLSFLAVKRNLSLK